MAERQSSSISISGSPGLALSLRQQVYLSRFPKIDIAKVDAYIGRGQQYSVYEYGDSKVIKIPHRRRWYPNATAEDQKRDLDFLNENYPENALPATIHVAGNGHDFCVLQKRIAGLNLTPAENAEVSRDFEEIIERNRKLVRDVGVSLDFLGLDGIKSCYRAMKTPGILPELSNLIVVSERQGGNLMRQNAQDEVKKQTATEAKNETIYGSVRDESISSAIQGWMEKESTIPVAPTASRIVIPDFTLLRLKNGPDSALRRILYRIGFKANRVLMKKFWEKDIG